MKFDQMYTQKRQVLSVYSQVNNINGIGKRKENRISMRKRKWKKKMKNASKLMLNDDMHYALDAFFLSFVCLFDWKTGAITADYIEGKQKYVRNNDKD